MQCMDGRPSTWLHLTRLGCRPHQWSALSTSLKLKARTTPIGECRYPDYVGAVTVDLDTLPAELARSVRAARRRHGNVDTKALVSKGLDPVIGVWAKSLIASGDLDAAIAEIAASDPDLDS